MQHISACIEIYFRAKIVILDAYSVDYVYVNTDVNT